MSAPDPIDALVAFLKADGDVNTATQGRIHNSEVPEHVAASMPIKLIVVGYAGGPGAIGRGYQRYGDLRADVKCYGATPQQARQVYLAAFPALKNLSREIRLGCFLHWARQGGGPISLRDPDTKWPYVFSSWQVLAAEVPAA